MTFEKGPEGCIALQQAGRRRKVKMLGVGRRRISSVKVQASSRNSNLLRSRRGKTDTDKSRNISTDVATWFSITTEDEGHYSR